MLVSHDRVGTSMAGPGIRYWELARELAKRFEVTLAVPAATDLEPEGFAIVETAPRDSHHLTELGLRADAVVSQQLPLRTAARLARSSVRTIYDLYAPVTIEALALFGRGQTVTPRDELNARHSELAQQMALLTGDGFICASEKQRDLWLGALALAGRLDPQRYRADPAFRSLIDVVPFGIDPRPPRPEPVLRGVVPGIGTGDRVLLWGGGIWNWFDPLTVIRAVSQLAKRRPELRLYFLGTRHPNPEIEEMSMTVRAFELAEELGVRDRIVFFNEGWVPYERRGAYLLEADIGVSAHFDDIETRFAFRTRMLDYLWAGLPIVATQGDALSEVVRAGKLGRVVDFGDVQGWMDALDELLSDETAHASASTNVEHVRAEYEWPVVTQALTRMLEFPAAPFLGTPRIAPLVARDAVVRARLSLLHRGVRGALRKQLVHKRPLGSPP
ncbi:MAG: glycosyltransferase family 4 protein [Actinomycetota bacterium]|nr:glycosyltransferase family 4 protein [Actinomycetota bacterium]